MRKKIILILTSTLLLSCGKDNTVDTPTILIEKDTQKEKINTQQKDQSEEKLPRVKKETDLPQLPKVDISVIKASTNENALAFGAPKEYIKVLKNKVFREIKLSNEEIEILSNPLIFNSNRDLELLSHFNEHGETELKMNIEIKSDFNNIGIENIVVDFYVARNKKIDHFDSVIISHLKDKEFSVKLTKENHKDLLQGKAYIGMIIKEFTFFKDGKTYSSNEYKKELKINILGDKFERLDKKTKLNIMKNGDTIFMLNGLPNTTTELNPSLFDDNSQSHLGKWVKKDSVYAYIRNSDTKLNQVYYYSVSTEHVTYKQQVQTNNESFQFFLAIDLNSIGPIIKSNNVINGYNCHEKLNNSLFCDKIGGGLHSISIKPKTCRITRSKINRSSSRSLNTSLFDYNKQSILSTVMKDNKLYIKSLDSISFKKKTERVDHIKTGVIENSCTFKRCAYQQSGCFLNGDFSSQRKLVKEETRLNVIEKR